MALRSLFSSAVSGLGKKLGLPEFGISERISNQPAPRQNIVSPVPQGRSYPSGFVGPVRPQDTVGGQRGNQFQFNPAIQGGGQVLGASTGGGGGGRQPSPTPSPEGNLLQQTFEQAPEEPQFDFGAINDALGSLEALESETRTLLGGGQEQAEAFRTAATGRAEASKEKGLAAIGQQEQRTQKAGAEAEAQQRRGFSEISQQLLGRFGKTGFGQGVTGTLGESTLQTIGKIRAGVEDTMQQLFQAREQVETELNTAIEDANFQSEQLKNQARSNLQNALSQIGAQRGALQSQKADLVNRALESYRQNIIDVNTRNTQFNQQLAVMKQQADAAIQQAQARAANTVQSLASFSLSPGETKVLPLSELGGAEQAAQFTGTQLPGVQFGQAGQFGVFSAPQQQQDDLSQRINQAFGG